MRHVTVSPATERLTRDAIESLEKADGALSRAILALYPQDGSLWTTKIPDYTAEQAALVAVRRQIRASEARLRKMLPDPD